MLALPWAWLGLFLLAPAAIVLKISLAAPADGVPPYSALLHWGASWLPRIAISLDSYALILGDPLYLHALLLSVKVAGYLDAGVPAGGVSDGAGDRAGAGDGRALRCCSR